MNVDRAVPAFAAAMARLGVLLGWKASPHWLLLPGIVGLDRLQASLTGSCPLAMPSRSAGIAPGAAFR